MHHSFDICLILSLVSTHVVSIPVGNFDTVNIAAGNDVTLPCKASSNGTVFWGYYSTSQGEMFHISVFGEILNGYAARFSLRRKDLFISNATDVDGGLYTCIEGNGVGDRHHVLLSVVGRTTRRVLTVTTKAIPPFSTSQVIRTFNSRGSESMMPTSTASSRSLLSTGINVIEAGFFSLSMLLIIVPWVLLAVITIVIIIIVCRRVCRQHALRRRRRLNKNDDGLNDTALLPSAAANDYVDSRSPTVNAETNLDVVLRLEARSDEDNRQSPPRLLQIPTWHDEENNQSDQHLAALSVKLIQSLCEGNEIVYALTTLPDELYVAYWNGTLVVYETPTCSRFHRFQLPRVGGVTDMTSCSQNQCIYIADWYNKVVHRVENDNEITQWHVDDEPWGLSVNSAYNVLVTFQKAGKIKEFTTYGQLVRGIRLQSDIVSPHHTVELTTDQFVVCHGEERDPLHRVCIVNNEGDVKQSYGRMRGSGSGQLDRPIRLAVMNGKILVADSGNHRVVMLSPTLSYIRELVSDLNSPSRVWFDKQTSRLYIAYSKLKNDKCLGQVNIYSLDYADII